MKAQRQRDTSAELGVRSLLHRKGLRFRVHYRIPDTRRTVDIAFPRLRLAVFVDGCFWHGCPQHGTAPKENAAWWQQKIEANRQRDADTNRRLVEAGWQAMRVWEHEDPVDAARRVEAAARDLAAAVSGRPARVARRPLIP
jgi:DNA mismatch endonuclease (patch repair protein)